MWARLMAVLTLAKPTALQVAVRGLEDAQRSALGAAAHREEWTAAEKMYDERIKRLRGAVKKLSQPEDAA